MTDIATSTKTGVRYPVIGGAVAAPNLAGLPPSVNQIVTDIPRDSVAFDVDAFDTALGQHGHGVPMVHYRAMRCPVGMVSTTDIRKSHEDHPGCSHGFLYTYAGPIVGLFTGQSTGPGQSGAGTTNDANAQITAPRFYEGTQTPFYAALYDRIYLADPQMVVTHWQTFTKALGDDKLHFPAEIVQDLVDADAQVYQHGVDFEVVNGKLRWTKREPRVGIVLGARFLYRPYWYVRRLEHEVRMARADVGYTGSAVQRMPQAMALQREWLFESELSRHPENALTAPVSARQPPAPPKGQEAIDFGPR